MRVAPDAVAPGDQRHRPARRAARRDARLPVHADAPEVEVVACGEIAHGDHVAAGGVPTISFPAIVVEWGSQTKLYVPSLTVTVKDRSPTKSMSVETLTPGPERWKLWMSERSWTSRS